MRLCRSSLGSVQLQEPTKCQEIDARLKMSARSALSRLPPSTVSIIKRCIMSCLLIGGFLLMLYGGPPFLVILTLTAQVQSWREVTLIALKQQAFTGSHNMHYFFLCALLYFWCDNLLVYYHPYTSTNATAQFVENHYKFICFCLHFLGVIWFVVNLKRRRRYRAQFGLLAWTHVLTLVIIVPSCLITKTIYQGVIWFVICVTTITSNDIMAYICGKLFGKTPLIALSPKKTWEGFIGAGIFTIIISCVVSYTLLDKQHLICPVEYRILNGEVTQVGQCIPDEIFQLSQYNLLGYQLDLYPIVVHTFWLAIFGSVIAPFGGFFASGFKRACNIKDFGASIPGHGGVLDRFDCQLVMIVFIHVYISTFVERNSVRRLFHRITNLSTAQQMEMYHLLESSLL